MSQTQISRAPDVGAAVKQQARRGNGRKSPYPYWFMVPAGVIYVVLFLIPVGVAFYFSLTRWTLFDAEFIGFDNYIQFFKEPSLVSGLQHTLIYAVLTSGLKVVIGMALALLLISQIIGRTFMRSVVFFPVLVSTIGVGLTFQALMDPDGAINAALGAVGIDGPGWLTDPSWALYSVILVDVWKGVGLATVIYIAGLLAIPAEYYEASKIDGTTAWQRFRFITLPLSRPATASVILLSLIGGLRSFDLIWAMTGGGPGFSSDVIASVIYKQYQAGFFGLSTAGNVVLFLLVTVFVLPLFWLLNRKAAEL